MRSVAAAEPILPGAWLWSFPAVYLVHLLDERLYWIGTAEFATRYLGMYFTNPAWLWVNVPSFVAVTLATGLVARGRWPQWVVVALATHLALHTIGRVPGAIWFGAMAPGLLSGLLVCLPLAVFTLARAFRRLSRSQLRNGLGAGVLSFQPLWHFLLLPVLPRGPAVG